MTIVQHLSNVGDQIRNDADTIPLWDASRAAGERTRTCRELNANADAIARAIQAGGVSPGDRVAILSANRLEFVEVLFGCMRACCVPVPVNTRLPDDGVDATSRDSGARLVFADGPNARRVPNADRTAKSLKAALICVADPDLAAGRFQRLLGARAERRGAITWLIMDSGRFGFVGPGDLAAVLWPGGANRSIRRGNHSFDQICRDGRANPGPVDDVVRAAPRHAARQGLRSRLRLRGRGGRRIDFDSKLSNKKGRIQ